MVDSAPQVCKIRRKKMQKNIELEIFLVETKNRFYLNINNSYGKINDYLVNDKKVNQSFLGNWGYSDSYPVKISKFIKENLNKYKLILKDIDGLSEKFEKELCVDEVLEYCSGDIYDSEWKEEYEHLKSLYDLVSIESREVEVEYKFTIIQHIKYDDEIDFKGMKIPAVKTSPFYLDSNIFIDENDVAYEIGDSLTVPKILIHDRPCKLSSEKSYCIVRKYIKDNIDERYGIITSDYDFCFKVCKKIKSEHIPKDSIEVFSMTYSPTNYKGYIPIKPFEGKNLNDLKINIESFCKEIIAKVNSRLMECPHCKGYGVIVDRS
jgi:hypothetical protein